MTRSWIVLLAGWLLCGSALGQTVVKYVHTDALGSVVALSTAAAGLAEPSAREYEPYGRQLTPAVEDGPGYTGHVQDAASGLTYMQQRYYDPATGRFISADPVTAYANPFDHFNRYSYAKNGPYNFIDPDGRVSDTPERHPRDSRSLSTRISARSEVKTINVNEGSHRRTNSTIKYNAPPPKTTPPSGSNLQALQCTANCTGMDTILVTGGAELSGHSRKSLHYLNRAVDIPGPPFNRVSHELIMQCAQLCGYTHGGWEVQGRFDADGRAKYSARKDHWHFQIGASGKVPSLPGFDVSAVGTNIASPTSKGGMIGP